MMNRYEMIYIIDADLEETARKELCPASSSVTCRSTRTFSVIS